MKRVLPVVVAVAVAAACSSGNSGFESPGADAGGDGATEGGVTPDFDATFGNDGPAGETGPGDGSIFNDGAPDVRSDACVSGDAGPAPFPQRCAPAAANECAGATDTALGGLGVPAALLNGAAGNGFDDDCDGLVDEGCACAANGTTKDCYLVPATQANPQTKKPVGWCTDNSTGSLDCAGAEFPSWSGTCRGAQPPYRHDVCAPGDFNCDGLDENSDVTDCACKIEPVTCPTTPVTFAPYPDPKNIPAIDGSVWINNPADRPNATNWTWTLIGGDCDNVLPHPTFAIYTGKDSTVVGARKGVRQPVKYDNGATPARYVVTPGEPLIGIQALNYGNGVAGAQVYAAFALSGDYVVQGEWDLGGTHYACTQKVQVRAPGIRAELCWDSVGGSGAAPGNDIDLHFARLQGVSCGAKGWGSTCPEGTTYEDCWWSGGSGCRDGGNPGWGYADSALTACHGWASKRISGACTNPRLDRDNITCDPAVDDPNNPGDPTAYANGFCGPENINLDNPKDGDGFVVGVNHYGNTSGSPNARPHVNLYCNGARVLSVGYNPLTGQTQFPLLTTPGRDVTGDFWTAATVFAHVDGNGNLTSCTVSSIPSHHADPTRDGPTASLPPNDTTGLCVDSTSNQTPAPYQYSYLNHAFIDHPALQNGAAGTLPVSPGDFCKH
jgi:hypothetical protein